MPENRYAMAGGCYALKSQRTGKWVGRDGSAFGAGATGSSGGTPFHFQATDLGRYLLYGDQRDFVAQHHDALGDTNEVESGPKPSWHAVWKVLPQR